MSALLVLSGTKSPISTAASWHSGRAGQRMRHSTRWPDSKRSWPALKASASEPMRVKRLATPMAWRARHLEGGPQRAHRALDGERRRVGDHPRRPRGPLAQLVARDDLGDQADLAGPLGRHALVRRRAATSA